MTADGRPWVEWDPNAPGPKPAQGARIRHEYGFNFDLGRYYIHPDDVPPTDPDADLIDRVARMLAEKQRQGDIPTWSHGNWADWADHARAAVTIVRQAGVA